MARGVPRETISTLRRDLDEQERAFSRWQNKEQKAFKKKGIDLHPMLCMMVV